MCPANCSKCYLCEPCQIGYFGATCRQKCSSYCVRMPGKQTCDKNSGHCIFGCIDGYRGESCTELCKSCGNFVCSRNTGICERTCKANYYGKRCENECSNHCVSRLTPRCNDSDVCSSNVDIIWRSLCDEEGLCYVGCTAGWRGDRCDRKCSEHCNGTVCNRSDGSCLHGCIDGYKGISCYEALEATGLDEDDGNKGLIIGMVLGWGLLAVLIIAGVVFFIIYRKRRQAQDGDHNISSGTQPVNPPSRLSQDRTYEDLHDNTKADMRYEGVSTDVNDHRLSTDNEYTSIDVLGFPDPQVIKCDNRSNCDENMVMFLLSDDSRNKTNYNSKIIYSDKISRTKDEDYTDLYETRNNYLETGFGHEYFVLGAGDKNKMKSENHRNDDTDKIKIPGRTSLNDLETDACQDYFVLEAGDKGKRNSETDSNDDIEIITARSSPADLETNIGHDYFVLESDDKDNMNSETDRNDDVDKFAGLASPGNLETDTGHDYFVLEAGDKDKMNPETGRNDDVTKPTGHASPNDLETDTGHEYFVLDAVDKDN